jgi:hypothetical protein
MLCVEILYQDIPASTNESEGAELYGLYFSGPHASSQSEESFCLSSSPDKQKKLSLGVLCASAVNKLSNNRRDAEFAENICFAQSGDGDWAKNYWSKSVPEFNRTEHPMENITTKSRKDTK